MGVVPSVILLLFFPRMFYEGRLVGDKVKQQDAETVNSSYQQRLTIGTPQSQKENGKLLRRQNLRPLLLATSIALFNQLSGVNILLVYLLDILSNTGVDWIRGRRYTLLLASLGFGITICGAALVGKVGHKPLLVFGAAGMSICLFVLSATLMHHHSLIECMVILAVHNACFAFSQGTVIWLYLSELFPFDVRAKGQSYGASVHWIVSAIPISLFPTLQHFSPEGSFRLLGFIMMFQIVVALIWYPETREIQIKQELEMHPVNLLDS